MKAHEYPAVKFTTYFIGGIIFAEILPLDFTAFYALAIVAFLFTLLFLILKRHSAANVSAVFAVFLLGATLNALQLRRINSEKFPFEKSIIRNAIVYGKIIDAEIPREKSFSFTLECDSVITSDGKFIGKFYSLVKIKTKGHTAAKLARKISLGDVVQVKGKLIKPRGKRNPGEFDYAAYLRGKNVVALIYCNKIIAVKILRKNGFSFADFVFRSRLKINEQIDSLFSGRARAFAKALILGERRDMDKSVVNDFIHSGIVHVLAVSGLHVGFVVMIFLLIFGRFGIFARGTLTIIGLILFALISGAHPSVVRAVTMATLFIVAFLSGRDYNPINVLFLAALFILAVNPRELFNPGFQLSFSAVLSILIFYPLLRNYLSRKVESDLSRKFLLFLSVSFTAQIGTLPFTLIYFHKLSIVALATNIIAIPLIGLILALLVASLLFSAVSAYLASLYAVTFTFAVNILIAVARFAAETKFAYISVYNFTTANALLYYVALFVIVYALLNYERKAKIIVAVLTLLNFYVYSDVLSKPLLPAGKFSVIAIDIGQGDAFLVRSPDEETFLIDAGNATKNFDNGERVIIPLLDYLGVDTLDALFISHVDADHYRGSFSIIANKRVRRVYKPRLDTSLAKDVRYENFLKKNNCEIFYYGRKAIKSGGCAIYILNDTSSAVYNNFDMNNRSGILKICYGDVGVLFTGDLEKEGERFYVGAYGKFLESDVLKIGHHGSKSSTSSEFLATVKPAYAIISAGEGNKFGHPNFEVLQRLNKFGVEIKRTDKFGAVIFTTDGETVDFIDWKR
jgi:competence protein ComEC